MRSREYAGRWARSIAAAAVIAAMWAAATIPSGFGIVELVMFSGPGMILALAASWTAHVVRRDDWDWESAFTAAAVGGAAFPPLVAFLVAWSGTFDAQLTVIVLVLGAWLSLGGGLVVALVRWLLPRRAEREARSRVARVKMLQ